MTTGFLYRALLLLIAAVPYAGTALAQSYPSKPVRLIIPYSAGGATDVVTRIIAQRLPDTLGQQVVADNRPGAGSLIGTELAANSPADGYTLLGSGTPLVIVPHLYKKLTYDPLKAFTPIVQFADQPYVLTVHPSLGAHSVSQLIALAKQRPGAIDYASSGNGGAQHLFAAMFVSMAKIDMRHIPYKGSGMARADLLGGQIKVGCLGISSVISNHKAGQLRILAVTSRKHSAQLPGVPSISETVPGYEATLWSGLLAPAGTSPAVVKRIQDEVIRLVNRPEVKADLAATGTDVLVRGSKEFSAMLKLEFAKWGKVVRDVNLRIN